jgi:uncharacterized damage-inducible protein DinB
LRARLATERAGLLSQLLDLDEDMLSCEAAWDDWTAKDILAHVAAWDELFTERSELVLAGRGAEIGPVNLDEYKAAAYAERRGWSFECALDTCLTARRVYLDSFARVPEEELDRPIPIRSSDFESPRHWAEQQYRHDARHAAHLADWRRRLALVRPAGPKSLLLAALRASRKELLTAQALLPAEERETRPIRGQWTLKDVLGHIAQEERHCLDRLRQLVSKESPQTQSMPDRKIVSRRESDLQRVRSWEEVWRDLHATRQDLLRLLVAFSQDDLKHPCSGPQDVLDTPYRWVRPCIDRDREHAAELLTLSIA